MDQNTTSFDKRVLAEVKKAIDLWLDKTYNESEFYSHVFAIIRENSDTGVQHKEQLERLILKTQELLVNQSKFFSGHKSMLPKCKAQEKELVQKINFLLSHGYSIERFKNKTEQKSFF